MQLIKERPGVSMRGLRLESGRLVELVDEHVSGLNREMDVLLKRYVEVRVLKVRDTKSLCCR